MIPTTSVPTNPGAVGACVSIGTGLYSLLSHTLPIIQSIAAIIAVIAGIASVASVIRHWGK